MVAAGTGQRPAQVSFDRACSQCGKPHGKPAVRGGGPELSVSHSGDLVAVAVATMPVGVDVEQLDGRARELGGDDPATLARMVLAEEEGGAGRGRPGGPGACLPGRVDPEGGRDKARGDGLRVPFGDVVVAADLAVPRVTAWPYPQDPGSVSLLDLDPGPGYVAALAVIGRCHAASARDGSALLAEAVLA